MRGRDALGKLYAKNIIAKVIFQHSRWWVHFHLNPSISSNFNQDKKKHLTFGKSILKKNPA